MKDLVEIGRMTAVELRENYLKKEISPVEVTQAIIERMDIIEPSVHAFCTPTPALALQQAKAVEDRIAKGEAIGALAGIPIAVKDLISTADIKTMSGSASYEDFVPDEDDIVVERIKQAGAIILGKTNVPEFGYSGVGHSPITQTTRNPWSLDLTPGGSSAGSGVAVATGMGPLALGSDGGGSIRIPAAHCGVVGIKASMGRVPAYPGCRDERYPGISSWEHLEHLGPLARTVEDAALLLSAIAGPDSRDRHSIPTSDVDWIEATKIPLGKLKVAYSPNWGYLPVDSQVREVVEKAVKVFETDLGCVVEEANPKWEDPFEAFWALVALDTDLIGMRSMMEKYEHRMSPHLVEFLKRPWKAEDFTNAIVKRKEINNRMWRFMQGYDLLLTPTLAVPPFPINIQGPEKIDGQMVPTSYWLGFTFPINMTGQPAASVPAGWTQGGLPVGLQIIGKHLDDVRVISACAAFERAAPWKDKWPPLLEALGI